MDKVNVNCLKRMVVEVGGCVVGGNGVPVEKGDEQCEKWANK